ncbi:tetratricopeptide repeat protein [Streptomyces sp. NPDC057565]|uniref:tetratricopeptide repeat protein n=1 Tax=Streptomyces sp. NPDC057565 TaxID=3346169 RepID=UPI0036A2729E
MELSACQHGRSEVWGLIEALDLREQVLADYERVLGTDHPDTLTARSNLALAHKAAAAVQQPDTAPLPTVPGPQPPSDTSEQPA